MELALIAMIHYYAAINHIDPQVALAVAKVESGMNPKAVGAAGERGLFQLKVTTYPEVHKDKLFDPETNIRLGIKYMAWNKKYCKHKQGINYLTCYNFGIKNAERVKHPALFPYVKKVTAQMSKLDRIVKYEN